MKRANEIAAEYLMRKVEADEPFSGPIPRCVLEHIPERDPEYVGLFQFIAGWVAVLALVGILFWGV